MNIYKCLPHSSILTGNKHFSRFKLFKLSFFLFILTAVSVPWYALAEKDSLINCDIQNSSCTQTLGGLDVTLDIMPKPVKALTDLNFTIVISGKYSGENPYIDLNMPAMDMGPNRVILKKTSDNSYEGKGVIVRCKSGHRKWKATVTIPGLGSLEYVFDVVY